jgi:hypothetical protein
MIVVGIISYLIYYQTNTMVDVGFSVRLKTKGYYAFTILREQSMKGGGYYYPTQIIYVDSAGVIHGGDFQFFLAKGNYTYVIFQIQSPTELQYIDIRNETQSTSTWRTPLTQYTTGSFEAQTGYIIPITA